MWYCESGCMEQRPSDIIFDSSDLEMFRQAQGVPSKWFPGNHSVLCSVCSNLIEVWIKEQPIWEEFLRANAKDKRLHAELEAGIRNGAEVESEMIEHELTVQQPLYKRAQAMLQTWIDTRKAAVTTQVRADQADRKAKRDAERKKAAEAKAEKK